MSSSNKSITDIINDGMATYTWGTNRISLEPTIEQSCYKWLEQAYPEIFAEFKAVHDVSK